MDELRNQIFLAQRGRQVTHEDAILIVVRKSWFGRRQHGRCCCCCRHCRRCLGRQRSRGGHQTRMHQVRVCVWIQFGRCCHTENRRRSRQVVGARAGVGAGVGAVAGARVGAEWQRCIRSNRRRFHVVDTGHRCRRCRCRTWIAVHREQSYEPRVETERRWWYWWRWEWCGGGRHRDARGKEAPRSNRSWYSCPTWRFALLRRSSERLPTDDR